jgi:hypothetical protein
MISIDPPALGSVYTASVGDQGKVGLCRLEVGCSPGTGKLKIAGGVEGPMRESINRAFAYLMSQKVKMGLAQEIDTTDFHVESIDLLSNQVPCEPGIALVVAVYSARYSTGTPARFNRDRSLVQLSGRKDATPPSPALRHGRASVIPGSGSWHSFLPSAEAYCEATPTECLPFFGTAFAH